MYGRFNTSIFVCRVSALLPPIQRASPAGTLLLSFSFPLQGLPHTASLWGGKKRYPPPPSWPAEMSGRSQRKRDYQRYGFWLYKCVSLFWCQQRIRCRRVTFGDNKISSQACGAALDRSHHRCSCMCVRGHNVCMWICWSQCAMCLSSRGFASWICMHVCGSKWRHGLLCALT